MKKIINKLYIKFSILLLILPGSLHAQTADSLKDISVNCDSLYPDKTIISLDTVLPMPSEVRLVPKSGNVIGLWSPLAYLSCSDCQSPIAFPLKNVNYLVLLKDNFHCVHQESFKIRIEIKVYNVITPNGDGHNDCLKIDGLPDSTPLKIFDNNGNLVYSTDSYLNSDCWSGTDNSGNSLVDGVYWYVLDNAWTGVFQKGFILIAR